MGDRPFDRRMDFDLQRYLTEMREELNRKIDDGFSAQESRSATIAKDLVAHQTADTLLQSAIVGRLSSLEELKGTLNWAAKVVVGALLLYMVKVIFFSPTAAGAVLPILK